MDLVGALNKSEQTIINTIHGKQTKMATLAVFWLKCLAFKLMANNVFGSGNKLWWYWFSGSVTKDGFTSQSFWMKLKQKKKSKHGAKQHKSYNTTNIWVFSTYLFFYVFLNGCICRFT